MDWDDAYDNMGHIPDATGYPARWTERAAAYRDRMADKAELDLAYGGHPRQRFDLFHPDGAAKGLVVFVHGGYWMKLDKGFWSHLAEGARARGYAVAVPSYVLTPEVRISDITDMIARAVGAAAARIDGSIRLSGHSAGGHLVTRLLCRAESYGHRIAHVASISGLHDLRPLLNTQMNHTLGLDAAEAAAESPVLQRPLREVAVSIWVGAKERPEFLHQAELLRDAWRGSDAALALVEVPNTHHFTVIDGLAEYDDPLTVALAP